MKKLLLILLLFSSININAQNTVGTITNTANSYNGLTLFAPLTSNNTYLINNCGEVVHQWTSTVKPGNSVYLLENGNLLRAGKVTNTNIVFGGVGGKVELFDWDSNLLWEYTYSTTTESQHHDVFPLPNGNILMLAATTMSLAEAIQAGRDPAKLEDGKLYNEQIIELQPVGSNQANIVWEWNIKDHLIQDFDATKDNFGVVADNPQLLNINYLLLSSTGANWLHMNSIQYNADLDQIIMSSRNLSEIYIIDHSTTTAQAASNSGGTYTKGGDFLYRWGNLEAYDKGNSSDRKLFAQHYPHWIPDGLTDAGKLMIFNNGNTLGFSSLDIIDPVETSPGVYTYDAVNNFLPAAAEWTYTAPTQTDFFSAILSSGQRLPNGNTLICDGDSGYFFEIDSANNIVWEYVNPDTNVGILNQGDSPSGNFVFRVERYSTSYAAFVGKDLTPGLPIEGNPDLSNCTVLSVTENELLNTSIKLHPNPVKNTLFIKSENEIDKVEIFTLYGQKVIETINSKEINFDNLSAGIYLIKLTSTEGVLTKKIVKQ